MISILRGHDSVKSLRDSSFTSLRTWTSLLYGKRDSVKDLRDSSVAPSSRDSIGMTGFVGLEGVKICWSGASANFYPLTSQFWLSFRSAVKIYDFRWWRNLVSSNFKWFQYCDDMIQLKRELLSRCVPFSNRFDVWGLRFSQRPESSSVTSFHFRTSSMYGKRDSSVAPSYRDSIGMTSFVVGGL